jgi:acetyl-CoA carboxylase/biotin carboxylase 1
VEECVNSFKRIMDVLISKYATRLLKLRVDEIEVKIRVLDGTVGTGGTSAAVPVRLIASSFTGGWLTREAYREYLDPITGQSQQYCTLTGDNEVCVIDPYPTSNKLQQKRASARRTGSTYATDFLGLLEVALINTWNVRPLKISIIA